MSKVLVLANHFRTLYNFRQELLDKLSRNSDDVIIAIPEDENDYFGKKGYSVYCIDVNRRGINPLKDIKLALQYWKLIKEAKPDMVLTYTIKPNLYGGFCCKLLKVPYISNITGLGSGFSNPVLKLLLKIMYKVALNKKANIFVQNEENLEVLRAMKIKPDSIQLIPGSGVNLEKYSYTNYPESAAINFYFVSRVMREKGIDEYLCAANHCKEKGYNVKFHIFGWCEEAYGDTLERLSSDGKIVYHGMCDDMRKQYEECSCIIHPSYHEGMSNVLLEASASGRPCICSNISGCKEIVEDGVTGFLVNSQDSESLIKAVEKFISLDINTRREMGFEARKKVEKEFDRNIIVNKYMDKINELTKG